MQRARLTLVFSLIVPASIGCGVRSTPDNTRTPNSHNMACDGEAIAAFIRAHIRLKCEAWHRADLLHGSVEACVAVESARDLRARSFEVGGICLDSDEAARCLASLSRVQTYEELNALSADDPCIQATPGRRRIGDPSQHAMECDGTSAYSWSSHRCERRCSDTEDPRLGQCQCAMGLTIVGWESHCVSERAALARDEQSAGPGEQCGSTESVFYFCARGLRCVEGRCTMPSALGQACAGDAETRSCVNGAFCAAGTCRNIPALGESCANAPCNLGAYCSSMTRLCEEQKQNGVSCVAGNECLSAECLEGYCSLPQG